MEQLNEGTAIRLYGISSKAYAILSQPSIGVKHKLFCQVLIDEIENYAALSNSVKSGVIFSVLERLPFRSTPSWSQAYLVALRSKVIELARLLGEDLGNAVNEEDEELSIQQTISVAKQTAVVYEQLLKMLERINSVEIDPDFEPMFEIYRKMNAHYVRELESFGTRTLCQIEEYDKLPDDQRQGKLIVKFDFDHESAN